jgi:hypothetical protein
MGDPEGCCLAEIHWNPRLSDNDGQTNALADISVVVCSSDALPLAHPLIGITASSPVISAPSNNNDDACQMGGSCPMNPFPMPMTTS